MIKIFKKVIAIMLGINLFIIMNSVEILANEGESSVENADSIRALELINELVVERLKEEVDAEKIESINLELKELGVEELTHDEVQNFFGGRTTSRVGSYISTRSAYPLPPSTSKITFYALYYKLSNGQRAYQLIATPVQNSTHSANQATNVLSLKAWLTNGGRSVVGILADKIVSSVVSGIYGTPAYFIYELFDGVISANTTSSQIEEFQAKMYTRTVHQFVYLMNSYNEPIYYGSANCVHYTVKIDTEYYVGAHLRGTKDFVEGSIVPDGYYRFPEIAIIEKQSTATTHIFVKSVRFVIDSKNALVLYPVQYRLPMQAVS